MSGVGLGFRVLPASVVGDVRSVHHCALRVAGDLKTQCSMCSSLLPRRKLHAVGAEPVGNIIFGDQYVVIV